MIDTLPSDDDLLEQMVIEGERTISCATPDERLAAWIVYTRLASFVGLSSLKPKRMTELQDMLASETGREVGLH